MGSARATGWVLSEGGGCPKERQVLFPKVPDAGEPETRGSLCHGIHQLWHLALFPDIGLGSGGPGSPPQQLASEFVFLDKPLNLSELQSHPCEMVRVTRPSGGPVGGLLGSLRENERSALEKAKSRYLLFRAILFDG